MLTMPYLLMTMPYLLMTMPYLLMTMPYLLMTMPYLLMTMPYLLILLQALYSNNNISTRSNLSLSSWPITQHSVLVRTKARVFFYKLCFRDHFLYFWTTRCDKEVLSLIHFKVFVNLFKVFVNLYELCFRDHFLYFWTTRCDKEVPSLIHFKVFVNLFINSICVKLYLEKY